MIKIDPAHQLILADSFLDHDLSRSAKIRNGFFISYRTVGDNRVAI